MKWLVVLLRTSVTPLSRFVTVASLNYWTDSKRKKYNGRSCACNKTITELHF